MRDTRPRCDAAYDTHPLSFFRFYDSTTLTRVHAWYVGWTLYGCYQLSQNTMKPHRDAKHVVAYPPAERYQEAARWWGTIGVIATASSEEH